MKWNWGVGITVTIIVFTIISLLFIYFAFNQDINLVRDDYYEAEVQFNEKLETIKRTKKLSEELKIKLIPNNISIQFPNEIEEEEITGTIFLYRPSDGKLDFDLPIEIDTLKKQLIPTNKMIAGQWKIQIEWSADTNKYFNNKILMVQ
jgi:nitrogen fixation protein FixH